LARRRSINLVATVEPTNAPSRTVCLVCHLDTSRSGLMFHRGFLPWLHRWIGVQAAALAIAAASPMLGGHRAGRSAVLAARAVLAAALLLLAERELRGVDVPGANDNASGVAAVATLLCELSADPLRETRVIGLFTGCEEAGVLGADAFLRQRDATGRLDRDATEDWRNWLFLNFDGVGAPASLHYLRREGVLTKWSADPALVELAGAISDDRPELELSGTDHNAGLTYDVTPVLAGGGRAITFSAQDATIPNYHAPTDTAENLDPGVLERAMEVGREMLRRIDLGAADP
jgi:Peptidase family M28